MVLSQSVMEQGGAVEGRCGAFMLGTERCGILKRGPLSWESSECGP